MLVPKKQNQQGSVLIEALISVLIFSIGVLSLVGLQSAMTKNSGDNQYRAQATQIAQTHMAQIVSFGLNANEYINNARERAQVSTAQALPNGEINFPPIDQSLARVTVTWQLPGGRKHEVTASAYLFDEVSDSDE
jgi:type IV pilus assembly protein PilV